MNAIDVLFLITSLSLVGVLWYWCLYHAYPIFLDKQVRRGKSWIYLPKYWDNSKRMTFNLLSKLLVGLVVLSFMLSVDRFVHFRSWPLPLWLSLLLLSIPLFIGVQIITKIWIKVRYVQQEKFYFDKLNTKLTLWESQGREISEVEIRNRVRWEHQNALRRADEADELLRVLNLNTKIKH